MKTQAERDEARRIEAGGEVERENNRLRCVIDGLDCERREGNGTLHCPIERKCTACRNRELEGECEVLRRALERAASEVVNVVRWADSISGLVSDYIRDAKIDLAVARAEMEAEEGGT